MSLFYNLLKEKATNLETKDKLTYFDEFLENSIVFSYDAVGFTYAEFYNLVNEYIDKIKNSKIKPEDGKERYVVVYNDLLSLAAVIAMLECGFTPVIIDRAHLISSGSYEVPYIFGVTKADFESTIKRGIEYITNQITNTDSKETSGENELIICSSGSEGMQPHLNRISEDSLINTVKKYGEDNSTFHSYVSCANISGILTNLVNPLLYNNRVVLSQPFDLSVFNKELYKYKKGSQNSNKHTMHSESSYFFSRRNLSLARSLLDRRNNYFNFKYKIKEDQDKKLYSEFNYYRKDKIKYNIPNLKHGTLEKLGVTVDSVMLPRNIEEIMNGKHFCKMDFSNLKHIYLTGGINSQRVIDKMRKLNSTINEGVFENLYGATEAGGVICSCKEKNFKNCYIDVTGYNEGRIIYTFDKKNFYLTTGEKVPYEFDELKFTAYLPVSDSIVPNVQLDDESTIKFKDIKAKEWVLSSDLGVYIDGKLYVLGRKKSLTDINNKTYILNSIEEKLSEEIGYSIYCVPEDGNLHMIIDIGFAELSEKLEVYKKALELKKKYKELNLNTPVLCNPTFSIIKISGKVSRPRLNFFTKFASVQYNFVTNTEEAKKDFLNVLIKKCLTDYEVGPVSEDFRFKVKCKKTYFYPNFLLIDSVLKIVSFDDEKGEIEYQLLDKIIFDITSVAVISSLDKIWQRYKEEEFITALAKEGLPEDIKEVLKKYDNIEDAYQEINLDSAPAELNVEQMRINIVVKLLSSFSPEYREAFLNGTADIYKRYI